MGKQSRSRKPRKCPVCAHEIYSSANGLREHVGICKRIEALNLIVPGLTNVPGVKIISVGE